jgi:polysaccharide export outer membrane protein
MIKKIILGYGLIYGVLLGIGCGPPRPVASPVSPLGLSIPAGPPIDSLTVTPHLQAFGVFNGLEEYLIGPGDVLELTLRDVELKRETVTVRPDGYISFSLLENVQADGRTPTELDGNLTAELGRFLRNPKVDVEVKEYRSKYVSVLGAFQSLINAETQTGQGRYSLKGKMTALDIVLEAGGTSPDALLDQVKLIRGDRSYRLDLAEVLRTGRQRYNVLLQGKDILIVPGTDRLSKKVVVLGEVNGPDVFRFAEDTSLLEALSRAGGINATALREDIRVIRHRDGNPVMFSVDFDRITRDGDLSQNIILENNDIVYVPRSFMGDINEVINTVNPLLNLLLLPASFRDLYTTGGGLRVDTGIAPNTDSNTIFTRALPGTASKPAADIQSEATAGESDEEEGK